MSSENSGSDSEQIRVTDPDTGERLYHYEWNGLLWCENEKELFDWRTGTVECPHCGDTFEVSTGGDSA